MVGREGFEPSTNGLRVRGAHYTQYANQMVGICTGRINSPFCTNFGKKVPTCHMTMRTNKLTEMCDPLVGLNAKIDWEAFRPDLNRIPPDERPDGR